LKIIRIKKINGRIQKWQILLERRSNRTTTKIPEGQLVIVVDGIVVGSALSLLVTEDFAFDLQSHYW
jgi:hypothetical protein